MGVVGGFEVVCRGANEAEKMQDRLVRLPRFRSPTCTSAKSLNSFAWDKVHFKNAKFHRDSSEVQAANLTALELKAMYLVRTRRRQQCHFNYHFVLDAYEQTFPGLGFQTVHAFFTVTSRMS
jgi:hypothetical protein